MVCMVGVHSVAMDGGSYLCVTNLVYKYMHSFSVNIEGMSASISCS